MNVTHAMRPAGEERLMAEALGRINDAFRERLATLGREYPFLDVRLVEP